MKKIPSIFVREFRDPRHHGDNPLTREPTPGCEWVFNGEGVATRKWDGTAVRIRNGFLFKRYDAKHGKKPPSNFEPAQDPDPVTGHWPGWLEIDVSAPRPEERWIVEAYLRSGGSMLADGTYEAIGPKIQGNPEGVAAHALARHGDVIYIVTDLSYDGIKAFLAEHEMEGVVWHHADGRMAKAKRRDFGLPWPVKKSNEVAA